MHRFFIYSENINDQNVIIDDKQARHIEKVLRLKSGDYIKAFDGTGCEYILKLKGRLNGNLYAQIETVWANEREPSIELYLAQGLAKGDKMNTIIQKAVEIGVKAVFPFASENTVVNLDKTKAGKKVDKWAVIAREACKQCGRSIIPAIRQVISFDQLLSEIGVNPAIMFYEKEGQIGLKEVLKRKDFKSRQKPLFIIIGAEGGFSAGEVKKAIDKGIHICKLGPRILRTETAGLAAASIILYEYGDLG